MENNEKRKKAADETFCPSCGELIKIKAVKTPLLEPMIEAGSGELQEKHKAFLAEIAG
jgi:hypothetical protein